ncbi:putative helicase Cas3 [Escherichia coli]|uniref:Putative helicase Cas3 n=1 Tax=Escherichia coli TaxID=562 RepID=A0A377CWT5_ECOLX|nr:putative helicase Cas3 [Escherichia coli]
MGNESSSRKAFRGGKKMSSKFQLLNDEELELFRTKQHRPMGQVILVSEAGESPYYNKRIGLIGS